MDSIHERSELDVKVISFLQILCEKFIRDDSRITKKVRAIKDDF